MVETSGTCGLAAAGTIRCDRTFHFLFFSYEAYEPSSRCSIVLWTKQHYIFLVVQEYCPFDVLLRVLAQTVIETLESRTLMSVSIAATKPQAYDVNPTTSGKGVFTISRTGSTAQSLEVDYSVSASSTASMSRYEPLSGSVIIPAGKKSAAVDVVPLYDATPQASQTLILLLSNSTNYAINPKHPTALVKITDKAPTVSLVTTKPHASEKDPTSKGLGQFTVHRNNTEGGALTVDYSINSGSTAISGLDFQPLTGSVVIPKGKLSAVINVVPIDDHLQAPIRSLALELGNGSYFSSASRQQAQPYHHRRRKLDNAAKHGSGNIERDQRLRSHFNSPAILLSNGSVRSPATSPSTTRSREPRSLGLITPR